MVEAEGERGESREVQGRSAACAHVQPLKQAIYRLLYRAKNSAISSWM